MNKSTFRLQTARIIGILAISATTSLPGFAATAEEVRSAKSGGSAAAASANTPELEPTATGHSAVLAPEQFFGKAESGL